MRTYTYTLRVRAPLTIRRKDLAAIQRLLDALDRYDDGGWYIVGSDADEEADKLAADRLVEDARAAVARLRP